MVGSISDKAIKTKKQAEDIPESVPVQNFVNALVDAINNAPDATDSRQGTPAPVDDKDVPPGMQKAATYLVAIVYHCLHCKKLVVFANPDAVKNGRKGNTLKIPCPSCSKPNLCVPDPRGRAPSHRIEVPKLIVPGRG